MSNECGDKSSARLRVFEAALEDFPKGNDEYGTYAKWYDGLLAMLHTLDVAIHTGPATSIDDAEFGMREHREAREASVPSSTASPTKDKIVSVGRGFDVIDSDNHTPTVTVRFEKNDWQARDAFARSLSMPSAIERSQVLHLLAVFRRARRHIEYRGAFTPHTEMLRQMDLQLEIFKGFDGLGPDVHDDIKQPSQVKP